MVGPARPWSQAQASFQRILQAREVLPPGEGAMCSIPKRTLWRSSSAPIAKLRRSCAGTYSRRCHSLRPNAAERLAETLRSWLLHQGQRDAVAADLIVHAQTVRYRMSQLREIFGERLNDPHSILELIVALSIPDTEPATEPA